MSETSPEVFKNKYHEIKAVYKDHFPIFTDGSKDDGKVGCAAISKLHQSKLRLPNNATIFSAEAKAIDLALNFISQYNEEKFIIFSDSLSVLQSINNRNMENPFIQNILQRIHKLSFEKSIIFCWIPSHVGINGNEDADAAAKKSLSLPKSKIKLPYTDFRPSVHRCISSKWQSTWNNASFNKLRDIKPALGEWNQGNRSNRREEVVLSRCRIGHTRFTHSYLLNGEDQPECIPCQTPLTIKHILIDCVDFIPQRNSFYSIESLKELFEKISVEKILSFLKQIGIYNKI
jgi:ribonuclease HI